MGLIIHHLRRSASERILWLCKELNVPYELKSYNREPATMRAPPEYKALSIAQTSPVIQDGDLFLAEAGACIEYIITKYGNGKLWVKPSEPGYADFLFWWHYSQGSLQPAMLTRLFLLDSPADSRMKKMGDGRLSVAINAVNTQLGKTKFLAGDELTAADIASLFYFTTNRWFVGDDISGFPNIVRYINEVGNRPAYVQAIAEGDPGFEPFLEVTPKESIFK